MSNKITILWFPKKPTLKEKKEPAIKPMLPKDKTHKQLIKKPVAKV